MDGRKSWVVISVPGAGWFARPWSLLRLPEKKHYGRTWIIVSAFSESQALEVVRSFNGAGKRLAKSTEGLYVTSPNDLDFDYKPLAEMGAVVET